MLVLNYSINACQDVDGRKWSGLWHRIFHALHMPRNEEKGWEKLSFDLAGRWGWQGSIETFSLSPLLSSKENDMQSGVIMPYPLSQFGYVRDALCFLIPTNKVSWEGCICDVQLNTPTITHTFMRQSLQVHDSSLIVGTSAVPVMHERRGWCGATINIQQYSSAPMISCFVVSTWQPVTHVLLGQQAFYSYKVQPPDCVDQWPGMQPCLV